MITEAFIGSFTGLMSVYFLKDGRRISFKKSPRIVKGQSYILTLDEKGRATLNPISKRVGL